MGRLRDGYEAPYIQGITEEVVDLFGVDDAILYRYYPEDNCATRDPLYDEPATNIIYRSYKIKCIYQDYSDDLITGNTGSSVTTVSNIYVCFNHLVGAAVKPDETQDYVSEGDLIEIHHRGRKIVFDILQCDRDGFINNTDIFTGYKLDVKRNSKYVPERKILPPIRE